MANLFEPEWDGKSERPGFSCRRAKLGMQAGGERLGASLYEIPPGQATFPFHAHFGNEELLIVIEGRPSLRTLDGWRELDRGEVVAFRTGPEGAHQVMNRGDDQARVLVVSEMNAPEVSLYPDTGKVLAGTRPPGGAETADDVFAAFRLDDAADYWEGEEPPSPESG
jgi:uncharacterized cupin superfamily protein